MVNKIYNWINGKETMSISKKTFDKLNPANGEKLCIVPRSDNKDISKAVEFAKATFSLWSQTPPVLRGNILHDIVIKMTEKRNEIAEVVHLETGKSFNDALGEVGAAIECGLFYASEGQRLYGRTTTSSVANKYASTIRQPIGVAGLVIAANTPIANIAWKVFPALICGNTVVLKSAEDTPATAWYFSEIAHKTELPQGVLNIVHGYGEEAGEPLIRHDDIKVISFTGSTKVGKLIQQIASKRMAKVSLELGGKNPLIVCNDADINKAVDFAIISAFSNAGQRCASGSRIILIEKIYNDFLKLFLKKTSALKIGNSNEDDFGPVINEKQLNNMIKSISLAVKSGAVLLHGGNRIISKKHHKGFYLEPTILTEVDNNFEISKSELFGPITCIYKAKDYNHALDLANDSPYGLTGSIHTKNLNRANHFIHNLQAGVAIVNGGTFGSEPHMPFGGLKESGNGTREPGTEALDIYSNLKDIYVFVDSDEL